MFSKRKAIVAAAVAVLALGGVATAVTSAGADQDPPPTTLGAPPPAKTMGELPAEVPIVDRFGELVRNPDGTLKMHPTAPPPLQTPTAPDVAYAEPGGVQKFTTEAPLVADVDD